MFENIPSNLPTPKEPEDIFSGGSKPASPSLRPQGPGASAGAQPPPPLRPAAPVAPRPAVQQGVAPQQPRPFQAPPQPIRPPTPPSAPAPQASRPAPAPVIMEKPSRSWLRVVLVLAILGGLGAGAYFFVTRGGLDLIFKQKAVVPVPQSQIPINAQLPSSPMPEAEPVPPSEAENIVPSLPIDSDGDGLTDADEAGLGTDPLKADSDDDGLLDNEEVRIYKSDPMNPDTDGDGYKDGDEVKNGYNPIGTGRLFQVPTQ